MNLADPHGAEGYLAGEKVEFRKRRIADDIRTVLIYATSPVRQVIGEFSIRETIVAAPETTWAEYGHVGVIDRDSFGDYYARSDQAVAFVVDEATRYERPQPLSEVHNRNAVPQSFYYVQRSAAIA